MKETYPFKIDIADNKIMRCHDICLMVGGFKSKKDAEVFAERLAGFIADNGNYQRVGFDA